MVIHNNFWIIRKTILVYIGFSDYILGLKWYPRSIHLKKYYLDPNRSILKLFLVENKYHGITGLIRPNILTFRVISWKKFSIIYLRESSDSFTLRRKFASYLSELLRSQNYFTKNSSRRLYSRLLYEQPRAALRSSGKTTVSAETTIDGFMQFSKFEVDTYKNWSRYVRNQSKILVVGLNESPLLRQD